MGIETGISWAKSTFNPWIGCTKVSPACDHCYAEARMDSRLHVVNWGPKQPRKRTSAANWRQPLAWNKQAAATGEFWPVFCASLADVFDNEVDPAWRADLFRLIAATPHLTWQLLTKRIGNAAKMIFEAHADAVFNHSASAWPWANVWLGITVCNQEEADRDIQKLLAVPAAKRFLSIEPILGPVDIQSAINSMPWQIGGGNAELHWVIAGGESGKDARPSHPDWFRSLRDQCASAGVPFFFKQWGEWCDADNGPDNDNHTDECWVHMDGTVHRGENGVDFFQTYPVYRCGTKATGNLLDGIKHEEFPA